MKFKPTLVMTAVSCVLTHFAATFAALQPQRTVAVVSYHAAAAGLAGHALDVLKKIPALILMAKVSLLLRRGARGDVVA